MGNAKPGGPSTSYSSNNSNLFENETKCVYLRTRKDSRFGEIEELEHSTMNQIVLRKERVINDSSVITSHNLLRLQHRVQMCHPNLLEIKGFTYYLEEGKIQEAAHVSFYFEAFLSDAAVEFRNRRARFDYFTDDELTATLHDCLEVLILLLSNGVNHAALTPDALVMGRNGEVKLADHGLLDREDSLYNKVQKGLHSPYVAPEVLYRAVKNSLMPTPDAEKADIFSLGMIFLYAATLEEPAVCYDWKKHSFLSKTASAIIDRLEERYSKTFCYTLRRMLEINPDKRPSFKAVAAMLNQSEGEDMALKQDESDDPKLPRCPTFGLFGSQSETAFATSPERGRDKAKNFLENGGISLKTDKAVTDTSPRSCSPGVDLRTAVGSSFIRLNESSIIISSSPKNETEKSFEQHQLDSSRLSQYLSVHEGRLKVSESSIRENELRFVDPIVQSLLKDVKNSSTFRSTYRQSESTSRTPISSSRQSIRAVEGPSTSANNVRFTVGTNFTDKPILNQDEKYSPSHKRTLNFSSKHGSAQCPSNSISGADTGRKSSMMSSRAEHHFYDYENSFATFAHDKNENIAVLPQSRKRSVAQQLFNENCKPDSLSLNRNRRRAELASQRAKKQVLEEFYRQFGPRNSDRQTNINLMPNENLIDLEKRTETLDARHSLSDDPQEQYFSHQMPSSKMETDEHNVSEADHHGDPELPNIYNTEEKATEETEFGKMLPHSVLEQPSQDESSYQNDLTPVFAFGKDKSNYLR